LLALARPRQWIKNGFVFAPLLFSASFLRPGAAAQAAIAALIFCASSSIVYIVNDIHDVEPDRLHPTKARTRPLAAGDVTLQAAFALLAVATLATILGGVLLPKVLWVVCAYVALNFAYTFFLKRQPIVDVFVVALGYVLRVYGGALAIAVPVSDWMFVTTLALALYLTFVKRRQELNLTGADARNVLKHYSVPLLDRYAEMSATAALVFYSMYVVSARPQLVFTVPLVMFGLFRFWFVVDRQIGGESPTDVVLGDPWLLATIGVWIGGCAWALWPA
jgi:4-hydroxybenzoate polyprenyltransferase